MNSQLSDTKRNAAHQECRSRQSLCEQNNNKNNNSSLQPPNIAPVSGVLNLSVNIFDILTSIPPLSLLSSKEFYHLLKTLTDSISTIFLNDEWLFPCCLQQEPVKLTLYYLSWLTYSGAKLPTPSRLTTIMFNCFYFRAKWAWFPQ